MYLVVIGVLSLLTVIPPVRGDWFGALFFYRNYERLLGTNLYLRGWFTGHYWSLSVEEHFYFLLPAIVFFTRKRHRIKIMSALIAIEASYVVWQLSRRPWENIQFHSDVRMDSLLIPALFAILIQFPVCARWIEKVGRFWLGIAVALMGIVAWMPFNATHVLGLSILMPIMLLSTVQHPESLLGRFLELPPLRFVGRISYSLYLWQELFFTAHYGADSTTLGPLQRWPPNLVITFACALASYYLLEQPAIRLGHRLASSIPRPMPAAE